MRAQKNWLLFTPTWNAERLLRRQVLLTDEETQGKITGLANKRMEAH